MAESEITPDELAALIDSLDLTPGYSMATRRAYVTLDGELLYAVLDGPLPLDRPGYSLLQGARVLAWIAACQREEADLLDALTPEQRDRYHAERQRVRNLPDPTDADMDRAAAREGRASHL